MDQFIQVGGALLILAAFTAAQAGRLDPHSGRYLTLNLLGSTILAYDALHGREWGFLLLELVWAVVSAWGVVGWARRRYGAGRRNTAAV